MASSRLLPSCIAAKEGHPTCAHETDHVADLTDCCRESYGCCSEPTCRVESLTSACRCLGWMECRPPSRDRTTSTSMHALPNCRRGLNHNIIQSFSVWAHYLPRPDCLCCQGMSLRAESPGWISRPSGRGSEDKGIHILTVCVKASAVAHQQHGTPAASLLDSFSACMEVSYLCGLQVGCQGGWRLRCQSMVTTVCTDDRDSCLGEQVQAQAEVYCTQMI